MAVWDPISIPPKRLFKGWGFTQSTYVTPHWFNRRRRTHQHGYTAPPYCGGAPPIVFQKQYFQMVQRAWAAGFGYPWGDTSYTPISFSRADWNNMAASFQYQQADGRFATLNGNQWFIGYQLAALSANLRFANLNVPTNATHPLLFTAAPDGTYSPTAITSVIFSLFYSPNPFDISPVLQVNVTPDALDNNTTNVNPLSGPMLCRNISAGVSAAGKRARRRFYYIDMYPYRNAFTVAPAPGVEIQNSPFECYPSSNRCWHQFFYVRTVGTWTQHSWSFGTPIACQEPGPLFTIYGPAQGV